MSGSARCEATSIRDLAVAAPLKLAFCHSLTPFNASSIRDLAVAAPLKQHSLSPPSFWLRTIRDLAVAAPLKHLLGWVAAAGHADHPRPSGRGPIEATKWRSRGVGRVSIRDLAVAAPLKRLGPGWPGPVAHGPSAT